MNETSHRHPATEHVERREVRSRGNRISYLVVGDGPPLLLLCGVSQWAYQWVDAGYVGALAPTRRVVAVDRLGHGASDKPHDPSLYRTQAVVEDVVAVLDAEGIDRTAAWGFSMGAHDAAALTALRPERVITLVYGSGPRLTTSADEQRVRHAGFAELLRGPDGLRRLWISLGSNDEAAIVAAAARNDPEALASAIEGALEYFAHPDEIGVPSLWYAGEREGGFDDAELAYAAAHGIETHLLPDASHYAAFRRAGEVLAFVEPFLARSA